MDDPTGTDMIYDWNEKGETFKPKKRIMITDETLRDGLQSPSVTHPSIQDKVYLLYLMRCLEIDAVDLGLCGAGERFKKDVVVLAREIVNQKMNMVPQSAARSLESDIAPIADASQEAGVAIEAAAVEATVNAEDALPALIPVGLGARGGEINDIFKAAFNRVVIDGEDVSAVLEEEAANLQALLDETGAPCWAPDPPSDGPCQVE